MPGGKQPQTPQRSERGNQEKTRMDNVSMFNRLCTEISAPDLTVAGLESALQRAGVNGAQIVPLGGLARSASRRTRASLRLPG